MNNFESVGRTSPEREAFDKNTQEIEEAKKIASGSLFGGHDNPEDVLDARVRVINAKQEREKLLGEAHDMAKEEDLNIETTEALGNKRYIVERFSNFTIRDWEHKLLPFDARLIFSTKSGNEYMIKREGSNIVLINKQRNTQTFLTQKDIDEGVIRVGEIFEFGNGGSTSEVAAIKVLHPEE